MSDPQMLKVSPSILAQIHMINDQIANSHQIHSLVGGLNPSEKYGQLGGLFPICGKIKNVPNHQPAVEVPIFHKFNTTKFFLLFPSEIHTSFSASRLTEIPHVSPPHRPTPGPGRPRPRAGCRSRPNTPRRPGRFGSSRPGHLMSCCHLVMTNSSPWKITIFTR